MIEARYENRKGFFFDPVLNKSEIINLMNQVGNAMVNFVALTPCSSGDKNASNANKYVMDRIVSKINSLLEKQFTVKAIGPTEASNFVRADGVIEVEHLIFQIQYA